jgi:Ala-tRNA(Pro) deacylase
MMSRKLTHYLKSHHVRYHVKKHPAAYSALTTAQVAHVPGKHFAKTVIVKVVGELRMFVIPAGDNLDINQLREILGTDDISLAKESEFEGLFSDCEPGGMPPFGNLYDMPVYASPGIAGDNEIIFNAGDHTNLVEMEFHDYEELVHPCILNMNER